MHEQEVLWGTEQNILTSQALTRGVRSVQTGVGGASGGAPLLKETRMNLKAISPPTFITMVNTKRARPRT